VVARKIVNVAVAAYVTTQAPLNLFEYLSKMGQSMLYCETDSVIYFQKEYELPKLKAWNIWVTYGYVGGVWHLLLHEKICIEWPQKLYLLSLSPLDRKTYNKVQIDGYNLELCEFKSCKIHCFEKFNSEDDTPLHGHNPRKIGRNHGGLVVFEPETKEYKVVFK